MDAHNSHLIHDITDREFGKIISKVTSFYNIMPMGDALSKLLSSSLPNNAVVITFDDGYKNNFTLALPILEKLNIKATFYIASGFLDGGWMWNDGIIEAVYKTNKQKMDLAIIGEDREWEIDNREQKMALINYVLKKIKYMKPEKRIEIARLFLSEAEVDQPSGLMMSLEQVKKLSENGMEIGGHTVSHPILNAINNKSAKNEIVENKHFLENIIQCELKSFAYPNGKYGKDFKDEHVEIVKEAGYSCAVTTDWGRVNTRTDLFQLPRFTPWDKNPFMFCLRLFLNR